MDISASMRIAYIIPGFDEGGAEVHVLNLIRELSGRHEITLISCGGRLESELPENVNIIHLPVERKNLFTGIYCALKLIGFSRKYQWDIIHVHSRVPAWIAWLASSGVKAKWLMTAHALYSLNAGLIPLRHADGAICISPAVRNHLAEYLPAKNVIIPNGIIPSRLKYANFTHDAAKFLFVGRLTRLKGLDVAFRALEGLKGYIWTLDVVGDGPQRQELEALSQSLGLNERVTFHGARGKHEVEEFMAKSSCLLFPSYSEGMGLVVLEALSVGLPVIASDLEALHELAEDGLVPIGDAGAWREAIRDFLTAKKASPLNPESITTVKDMACLTEKFYLSYF